MDVELRDLQLLATLDDSGSLTAAAKTLFVSQPALSQRLAKLESRLGGPLFDRDARRLVANPAGLRMVAAAKSVLGELRSATRDVQEIWADRDRRVRLTAQCSTAYQWLPPVLAEFRRLHPGVEVRIEQVPGDEPVAALLADRVDVALVTKPNRLMEHVASEPLFEDQMVAVVATGHPWARRPHVTARDFNDVQLVLYDIYDPTRIPTPALPLPDGARPGRITTVPLITDLVIEMVASGEGISVLPQWVAAPYAAGESPKVAMVQVGARPTRRTWHLATRRGELRSTIADLADLLAQRFASQAGTGESA